MYTLGSIEHEAGDAAATHRWWLAAAEHGNTSAMVNLGVLLQQGGRSAEAREIWLEAADLGDPRGDVQPGALADLEQNADGAREWRDRAAAAAPSVAPPDAC